MQFTEVAQLESAFEADILINALEASKIPFIINPHRETAYSGLFLEQRGWGSLLAPPEHHKTARGLLERLRESENEPESNPEELDP